MSSKLIAETLELLVNSIPLDAADKQRALDNVAAIHKSEVKKPTAPKPNQKPEPKPTSKPSVTNA